MRAGCPQWAGRNALSVRRQRLYLAVTLAVVVACLGNVGTVHAETGTPAERPAAVSVPDDLADVAAAAGIPELAAFLDQVRADLGQYAPDVAFSSLWQDLAAGRATLDPVALLNGLWRYLLSEVIGQAALLAKLIGLAVTLAVLHVLRPGNEDSAVGHVAGWVGHLAVAALAAASFALAFGLARDVVTTLSGFMQAVLPAALALLIANGNVASGGLFQPLMSGAVLVGSQLVTTVVLPLTVAAGTVELVGGFVPTFRVSQLVGLLRMAAITVLGLLFSVFLGLASIYRAAGSVSDSVTLRTGKFLAGSVIPVVGKMFSDAAELVMTSSALLTSAVGVLGVIGIVLLAAFPLIKLAALVLTYRVAGAVIQPVDGGGVSDMMNGIGNTMAIMLGAAATVALWFYLMLTILLGSATGAALRMS